MKNKFSFLFVSLFFAILISCSKDDPVTPDPCPENEAPNLGGVYMYGTTSEGGANGLGTIYRVDQNGANFEKVYDFSTSTGGNPFGGLTLANGRLYGFTTTNGQTVNSGASIALGSFFEFNPETKDFKVIQYIDDQSSIGNGFKFAPTMGGDGLLYMASESQGLTSREGVLSSFDPKCGNFTELATFTPTFGQPKSGLLEASDGNLYVTTNNGATGSGAIVKYDKTSMQLLKLHSSAGNGSLEYRNAVNNILFEASNGALYGASKQGGGNDNGIIFKINKDGSGFQTIYRMLGAGLTDVGYYPLGGFVEVNGKLYSSTEQEANIGQNQGTLFTIDIATNKFSFIHTLDLEGAQPRGTFTSSSNGRLYLTCSGGNINNGSIIEFNPLNGNVVQKHAFNTSDGTKPQYDQLCVIN